MNRLSSSSFPLDMNVNVDIKVLNAKGAICNHIKQHNKATINMTTGIVKFLRGEFSTTNLDVDTIGYDADSAKNYIPAYIGFGNTGTAVRDNPALGVSGRPAYSESDYAQYVDQNLRNEIFKLNASNGVHKNSRLAIERSTCGDSSLSDTFSLKLSSKINFNSDFIFKDFSGEQVSYIDKSNYWPIDYEKTDRNSIVITELGLFSGNVDDYGSLLLARMLLDSSTPLIIDSSSTVVINWVIGVYSIDDTFSRKSYQEYDYTETEQNFSNIVWETE